MQFCSTCNRYGCICGPGTSVSPSGNILVHYCSKCGYYHNGQCSPYDILAREAERREAHQRNVKAATRPSTKKWESTPLFVYMSPNGAWNGSWDTLVTWFYGKLWVFLHYVTINPAWRALRWWFVTKWRLMTLEMSLCTFYPLIR